MLRVVAICAVALACHLIVAADSDIIDDDYQKNETFVKEFITIQPEGEPRAETEGQDQADIIDDDYLKNETVVEKTIQQKRKPRVETEDEDSTEQTFCLRPPDIEGVISPILERDEHPLGTVVSYQCKFGYVSGSSGSLLSICRMSRLSGKAEWTHPNTTCIPRSCGDPGYVINGRRIGNLFTFPNSVKFECLEGYKVQGLKERYCQASGEWSGGLPTCDPIYCQVPTHPENGRVLYSSLDYGSELEYKCDKGFMLQNHQPRTCNEDGTWSNDEPECIETACSIPEIPEDVSVQLSEKPPKVGTLAFYSCSDGATLLGASTSKCLSSGDWTFDPPKCLRSCHVPEIQDGELGRNQFNNRRRQVFVLLPEGESVKHHELVTLRCKDGYSPRTRDNARLQEVECNDGAWSEPLHCHPTVCNEQPPPVANASPVITSRQHGSGIWYRCDPGYGKKRGGNVTCQYGKWKGPTPACADHRCHMNELNYPGLVKPAENSLNDGVHFKLVCKKGYKAESSWKKIVRCFKGKWDITTNPCIIKNCEDEPPLIENGQPREFARVNGSVVNYECDDGYELEGHSTVHCAFGTWEGNPPVCKPSIRNFETTTEKHLENGGMTVDALKLTPNSLEQKECFCTFDYERDFLAVFWGTLEIDSHHQIQKGERVSFQCRYRNMNVVWPNGLRFFERMDLICDRCQKWKIHDLPLCEPLASGDSFIAYDQNNPLKILPGGIIEVPKSERISFACVNRWLQPLWHNLTHAKRISFQNYSVPRGTGYYRQDIIIDEMDYEHTGRYECSVKYYNPTLRSAVLELKMTGFDVTCLELSTETNQGRFEITYSNQRKVQSIAHYTCKDPLKKIVGSNERVCLENGKWSHNFPACEDIRCPLLNENNVFLITYNNNRKINSEAFYYCKALHQRLIGSSNRTCLHSGKWSGTNPVCEDITCSEFLTYNGQTVTYSKGTKVGSIAHFDCLNHATLIGTPAISCLHNGTWSHPKPSCENYVSCDLFGTSPFLSVHYTDAGQVGSIARFQCLPPRSLVGNPSATCLSNGIWSHSLPICAPPNCSLEILEESLPENLYVNLENVTDMFMVPGTELPLVCEEHLVLTGRSNALCNFHGKWEFTDAQCISACRVNKEETSHLIVEPEKDYYRFGEFILLSCPSGLRLTSEVERMMCLGRTWSDLLPDCDVLTESNSPEITLTTRRI